MGKKIVVNVPASTANLGPGFDALGMALDLYNTVALEKMDNGCHIVEVKGEGESSLPRDNCNLVARAVSFLMQRAGYSEHGFKLSLDNQIPLMSGLGSSAAAIVGGLVAANALLGKPFTDRDVLQMAVEIEGHPDNVAAATISSGRVALGSSSEYGSEPLIFGPQETFHGEKPQVLFQARTGVTPKPGNLVVLDIPSIQWANQRSNNSAEPGTLGDSLHNKGLKTAAIGNSDVPGVSLKRSAALIAMDSKGIIDQGNVSEEVLTYDPDDPLRHRTDYSMLEELFLQLQPQTDFMVIDLGDLIRLDYKRTQLTAQIYEQEREKILHQYNDFIGMLIQNIDLSNNLLIVAATTPTAEASGEKRLFGFLGAQGDGLEEGLLKTPTSHHKKYN